VNTRSLASSQHKTLCSTGFCTRHARFRWFRIWAQDLCLNPNPDIRRHVLSLVTVTRQLSDTTPTSAVMCSLLCRDLEISALHRPPGFAKGASPLNWSNSSESCQMHAHTQSHGWTQTQTWTQTNGHRHRQRQRNRHKRCMGVNVIDDKRPSRCGKR
jgi:hypothetical protein